MPSYSISSLPCNELHLRLGRVVEPIGIGDFPSPMTEERMNQQFENSFSTTIPIIEDVETPTETHNETPA